MKQETRQETQSQPAIAPSPAPDPVDYATLRLLERWRAQDATDDPDEIRAAEQELAEFKKAMNESRILAGEPRLYP
jgi:hypothetical protein